MSYLVALLLVLLAGCGSPAAESVDGSIPRERPTRPSVSAASPTPTRSGPSPSQASQSSNRQRAPQGTTIITGDSEYGQMLFDSTGQPIYLFTAETGARPACNGDCAAAWPPVLTTGGPRASGGARADLLGTTRRTDGRMQVTYAGHPLYFYAHEGKYQVLCHDVDEYGGTWLVVRPDGTPVPGS